MFVPFSLTGLVLQRLETFQSQVTGGAILEHTVVVQHSESVDSKPTDHHKRRQENIDIEAGTTESAPPSGETEIDLGKSVRERS